MKQLAFSAAMKDYFGFLPGQTLSGFMQELKALNDSDRAWFKANLPSVGYELIEKA